VVQLRDQFVHPSLNLHDPIDRECRFAPAQAQPWTFEFAISNSFGFGGINSCVVFTNQSAV
jgi:malonyl-ACP decarboxylase